MNDIDLPEPKTRVLSSSERREHRANVLRAITYFVTAYAVLHRFAVPLFLKFTPLRDGRYAEIDFAFIHPLLLSYVLCRGKALGRFLSLLVGLGFTYGLYELVGITLLGREPGWLAVSKTLSALPVVLISATLLMRTRLDRGLLFAVGGAALALVIIGVLERRRTDAHLPAVPVVKSASLPLGPASTLDTCGARELQVSVDSFSRVAMGAKIFIRPCGFYPAGISLFGPSRLEIQNETDRAVNVHFVFAVRGSVGTRGSWSLLVQPGASVSTREIKLGRESMGMIYSDVSPQSGIVALLPLVGDTLSKAVWFLQREPLRIRELGEQSAP